MNKKGFTLIELMVVIAIIAMNESGFTLIELLVVIAIIANLLAIVIPALSNAKMLRNAVLIQLKEVAEKKGHCFNNVNQHPGKLYNANYRNIHNMIVAVNYKTQKNENETTKMRKI